jgi:ubiquitin C-terminal hydrolase
LKALRQVGGGGTNRTHSLVAGLFRAQFRSAAVCVSCQHESLTFDPFMTVSLSVPTKSRFLKNN